ncbi:MAG TPA: lipoyl(octanoyl) transferase LipB [Gemmatimonadaceae bacterium]|jgi:lipoate-protein ligase B|nr:lipoyl(octanoyl) transferase LipB [Gemmatimonadaceae bacterium]
MREMEVVAAPASAMHVVRLGLVPYARGLEIQRAIARARISGEIEHDVLLLLEHPPVVTMGRSAKAQNLTASPALLAARGVELFEAERGGDVTFHGPGQLVGYPIVNLRGHKQDLHWYLRQVEAVLMDALATFGIETQRSEGRTGVWTHDRKIASIGVHARDWVTWHGFALNVSTDLSYFDLMVPCGLAGVTMTSVARELGSAAPSLADVAEAVTDSFGTIFAVAPTPSEPEALREILSSF